MSERERWTAYQLRRLPEKGSDGTETSASFRRTPHALVRLPGTDAPQAKGQALNSSESPSSVPPSAEVRRLVKLGRFKLAAPESAKQSSASAPSAPLTSGLLHATKRGHAAPSPSRTSKYRWTRAADATSGGPQMAPRANPSATGGPLTGAGAAAVAPEGAEREPGAATEGLAAARTPDDIVLPLPRPAATTNPPRAPTTGAGAIAVPKPVYCPVYCQTGRCPRRNRGCRLKHDPTKRAVCPKWLAGFCPLGSVCPLQHQRVPALMPLCIHFMRVCVLPFLC